MLPQLFVKLFWYDEQPDNKRLRITRVVQSMTEVYSARSCCGMRHISTLVTQLDHIDRLYEERLWSGFCLLRDVLDIRYAGCIQFLCSPHRLMSFGASPAVRPISEAAVTLRRARLSTQTIAERLSIAILHRVTAGSSTQINDGVQYLRAGRFQ